MSWTIEDYDKSKFDRSKFDCGNADLNSYLKTQITQDFIRKANVPVLAVNTKSEVIGFYTLSSGAIEFKNFPEALKKSIAPYPVPIARIGRLAVDKLIKGQGLGKELLFHAIDRAEQASKKIGIRAIVVDAKDEAAENFYKKYGFEYLQDRTGPRKSLFLII